VVEETVPELCELVPQDKTKRTKAKKNIMGFVMIIELY
jgi:hypothetical protein